MPIGGNSKDSSALRFDNGSTSGFDSFSISRSSVSGSAKLFGGFFDSRHAPYSPEIESLSPALVSTATIEEFTRVQN